MKRKNGTVRGTKKRHTQTDRSSIRYHRKSVAAITMILLLLVCVLGVHSVTLQAKNKSYIRQEKELQSQIDDEKSRSKEVKEYEEYVKTDEYIKEVAEEKLGLVDPNEILFKPAQ